jgi:serine/threonine protein kinase
MSGETGSLRYMAPEVAEHLPYNHKADVYSFGIILWEMNAEKKPFDGINRETFFERVVHGGERPSLNRKWPKELTALMAECWDADMKNRPTFGQVLSRLDSMLNKEKGGKIAKPKLPVLSVLYNRHSTWF